MTRLSRNLRPIFALSAILVASAPVQAQRVAETKPVRQIKLDGVCAAPLERFCPELASTPGQTRNQVICLKPYRTSLPPACRSAVTAAIR